MKLGVTATIACWASISLAQPPGASTARAPAWAPSCEADVGKLCKDGAPSAVLECLAAHEKDLSAPCAAAFVWRYRVTQDCKEEIATCQGKAAAGGGTVSQCLKDNDKSLTDRCRAALVRGSKGAGERPATAATTRKRAKKAAARK